RQSQSQGRRQAHGMLKVEKVFLMPERLKFGGRRAHDGNYKTVLQSIVDSAQAFDTQHWSYSFHINLRVKSRAMGCRLLPVQASASAMLLSTWRGSFTTS